MYLQKRKLRSVFRDWDFDKSGALDLKELEANIKRQGVHLSPEQMKDLFDSHDTDKDGKLFYWEFIQMIYGPIHHEYFNTALRDHLQEIQKNVSKNTLRQDPMTMFRNIALENAKEIDDQAIQMTVHEKLQPFEKRINDVFCHFDADRSGRLSYNEFRTGVL
jgi:Ca2+-binding EF-hand superfamily protein